MAQDYEDEATLPLLTAGARLREARLKAGLELEEVAARTRVSKRYLAAIEDDDYAALASRTYAIGFSRTFARAVGLDEEAITDAVREELSRQEYLHPRQQRTDNFEPGDPARVPPSSLAWMAAIGAVVLFALIYVFWRSFLDPAGEMPDLVKEQPAAPAKSAAAQTPASAAPVPTSAPIRLTALADGVWIKVSNAAGEQLVQTELSLNESYAVPTGAQGPVLSTARPDVLRVTIGDRVVDRLRPAPEILRDLPLSPTSLLAPARPAGAPAAGARATETSTVSDR